MKYNNTYYLTVMHTSLAWFDKFQSIYFYLLAFSSVSGNIVPFRFKLRPFHPNTDTHIWSVKQLQIASLHYTLRTHPAQYHSSDNLMAFQNMFHFHIKRSLLQPHDRIIYCRFTSNQLQINKVENHPKTSQRALLSLTSWRQHKHYAPLTNMFYF